MAPENHKVTFVVSGPTRSHSGDISAVRVLWSRGGQERRIQLSDDGMDPSDQPWDGVWTGTDQGLYVREGSARILVTDSQGQEREVWSGIVTLDDPEHAFQAWQLAVHERDWRALQVPMAWPGDALVIPEAVHIYVGLAWVCLLLAAVTAMVRMHASTARMLAPEATASTPPAPPEAAPEAAEGEGPAPVVAAPANGETAADTGTV